VLENVDILIENSTIRAIGKNLEGEPVIDCSARVVLPGLINCHTHLGMTTLRGVSDDKELKEWLTDVQEREAHFTDATIQEGNYLGIAEALRSGTTTIVDTFFREELAGNVAEELGIRFYGAPGILNNHPLADTSLTLPTSSGRITYCFGPHAIYTTDESTLKAVRKAATEQKALIMIHLSETRKERADCKRERGLLPVEYLESIGFLGRDVLLVHCTWLTKRELDMIKQHNAKVVHCPESNMKLAGGSCMPVQEMLERGITVALGTDGVVSNNNLDMFREMHVAALLHKHHYWDPTVTPAQQILDMATVNGAKALGRTDIGRIHPEMKADIITLDLNDLNLQPHDATRIVSHLIYAASGMNVAEVIIDGTLIIKEKVFV